MRIVVCRHSVIDTFTRLPREPCVPEPKRMPHRRAGWCTTSWLLGGRQHPDRLDCALRKSDAGRQNNSNRTSRLTSTVYQPCGPPRDDYHLARVYYGRNLWHVGKAAQLSPCLCRTKSASGTRSRRMKLIGSAMAHRLTTLHW